MSKLNLLTMHGQSKDACLWVLKKYASNPSHKNNKTVQDWCAASREYLDLLEEDTLFEEALQHSQKMQGTD